MKLHDEWGTVLCSLAGGETRRLLAERWGAVGLGCAAGFVGFGVDCELELGCALVEFV